MDDRKVSDYIVGKIKNRVLIKITTNEREILFRILNKNTVFKPMPVVFQVNENGCWEVLTGSVWKSYPQITYKGKKYKLSRLIYEEYYNIKPDDKLVLHNCDNPGCINPEHLYLGTDSDNRRDYYERGKSKHPSKDFKRPKVNKNFSPNNPLRRFLKKISNDKNIL